MNLLAAYDDGLASASSAGLLALRCCVAAFVFGHATQKLLGWFGGGGLRATADAFDRFGYRPGRQMVILASSLEILGSVLLASGSFTPIAGSVILGVMLVACSMHWASGLWAASGGFELPLTFAVAGFAVAMTGPGKWSVDAVANVDLSGQVSLLFIAASVLGAAVMILGRFLLVRWDRSGQ